MNRRKVIIRLEIFGVSRYIKNISLVYLVVRGLITVCYFFRSSEIQTSFSLCEGGGYRRVNLVRFIYT